MRIYLLGYMYSGKTTVGHRLAHQLGYQWLDLDQAFEYTYHTSIPIFFKICNCLLGLSNEIIIFFYSIWL